MSGFSRTVARRSRYRIGKRLQTLERVHLFRAVDRGAVDRLVQDLDRLVVGHPIDRERRAVLSAVRERRTAPDRACSPAVPCTSSEASASARSVFGPDALDPQQRLEVLGRALVGLQQDFLEMRPGTSSSGSSACRAGIFNVRSGVQRDGADLRERIQRDLGPLRRELGRRAAHRARSRGRPD